MFNKVIFYCICTCLDCTCFAFLFFLLFFVIFTNSTGKSCHNQRIERLWRDVFGGCIVLFYTLFSDLERCGILDPNDDMQLWCLHHVFIPIINSHLTNWKNAWVHHPLRTERNATPMQLWITGLQRLWGTGSTVGREIFEVQYFLIQCILTMHCINYDIHMER